jgi:mono/diheme cytochrome c family protein
MTFVYLPKKHNLLSMFCMLISINVFANDALFLEGKKLYEGANSCSICHQPTGKGITKIFPPLVNNPWVNGNTDRLVTIVLKGIEGPIMVNGSHYMGSMPPQALFNDKQLAAILSYTRNAFGNKGSIITAKQVTAIRSKLKKGNSVKSIVKQYPFNKKDAKKNGVSNVKNLDAALAMEKTTIVRTFMPGSSPAAFAVAMPGPQYYCWDAGECRLRYVWQKGGFITGIKSHWSSNGKPAPSYNGQAYYRAKNSLITLKDIQSKNQTNQKTPIYDTTQAKDFPIQIGSVKQALPKYKGYRLKNQLPEFWYQSGGFNIYEIISVTADKKGIIRKFKVESKGQPVTFNLTLQKTADIKCSKGKFNKGVLVLTSEEALDFSITIKEVSK